MASTFAHAVNNLATTLASAHAIGDGQLVLAAGTGARLGTLPANRVWRCTAVTDANTTTEVVLGVFEATGRTGETLTGVTAVEGFADVALASGTTIQFRVTAKFATDWNTAINTNEAAIAVNAAAIALKANDSAVLHKTGGETVTTASATTKGLILKQSPGQSANMLEVRTDLDVLVASVEPGGNLNLLSANTRVTLGNNAVKFAHDGSNGTIQNNTGSFSFLNTSVSGGISIATNGTNRVVVDVNGNTLLTPGTAATKGLVTKAFTGQTANLSELQNSVGTPLSFDRADGSRKPASLADSAAVNDSIYYSTTQSKLVYKDSSGVANPLY